MSVAKSSSVFLALLLMTLSASAQVFFTDFNSGVPAGAIIPAGPAGDANEAKIDGGYLKLTDTINSSAGFFYVNDFGGGQPVQRFTATFKASIFGALCCGTPAGTLPADGFSFNLVPAATVNPNPPYIAIEDGLPQGLSVNFDTWDNGGGEAPSIEVMWLGSVVSRVSIHPSQIDANDPVTASKDVFINLDPDGKVSVKYGDRVVFDHLQTPYDASVIGAPTWVLGARTGGANDNHWIDDLRIVAAAGELQLIPIANSDWAYNDTTTDATSLHGTGWQNPGYDTNSAPGWKTGTALFGNDTAGVYDAVGKPFSGGINGFLTPLSRDGGRITFYFRKTFNWSGSTAGVALTGTYAIDDGFVIYLNGVEVNRNFLTVAAPDPVVWSTLGQNHDPEGTVFTINIPAASLVTGENVVAVEVHQVNGTSSDVAFSLGLSGRAPVPPTISDPNQPTNRVVFANRSTTLTVAAYGSPEPTYQWYKDGVAINVADNPTANSASLVIPVMQASDAGLYHAVVANAVGSVNSRTANIEYLNDVTPPRVVSATGNATFDRIVVEFDELIDPLTGTDFFNYNISDGVSTVNPSLITMSGRFITLSIDPPYAEDTVYTVVVSSVSDLTGNFIEDDNTASFRSF
jgi:hypothetical protein